MDVVATYGYRLVSPGRLANREGAARASGPAFETDASPEGHRKGTGREIGGKLHLWTGGGTTLFPLDVGGTTLSGLLRR